MRRLLLVVALFSCGSGPSTPIPPDELQLPLAPEAFFLEVLEHPGFVPIEYSLNQPPRFAASVGGRLIVGGERSGFPGAMLPPVSWLRVGRAAFDPILASVGRSALPDAEDVVIQEPSGLADVGGTTFRFTDREGAHEMTVVGFGVGTHTDPRVRGLHEVVRGLEAAAAAGTPADPGPPRALVYVGPEAGHRDPEYATDWPWPLPDPPPPPISPGFDCRLYEGDAAAQLLDIFAGVDLAARWVFEGRPIQLIARQLLPGEEGCPP